jgi:hypothetical protein
VAEGRKFDRGKFKELTLYLSRESLARGDEGFGMVKLNKLLYRIDFEGFRLFGAPPTGETYEKQEYGPVARDLPIILDELANEGRLNWQVIPRGPYERKVPTVRDEEEAQPDMSLFSEKERELIDGVLNELSAHDARSVSEWSHEESSGWQAAEIGQKIPYGTTFISTERLSDAQMKRAMQRSRDENWAAIRP